MASAGQRLRVSAHGLNVDLPARWEARIYRRPTPVEADVPTRRGLGAVLAHPAAQGWPGESPNPVLHAANFALPPRRGDFGTGAVERMGPSHAFLSLLEFDGAEAGAPLFAATRPQLSARDFAPNALQRRLPGQLGCQRFFTENRRPFCLYVVLGSRSQAGALVAQVREVVDRIEVILQ